MGIRIECDWCHQAIDPGKPYVTVEFDGAVQCGADKPQPVIARARVYCGFDRYHDDDPAAQGAQSRRPAGGANDGFLRRDSCFERALTALNGIPDGRVDAGFEWRLVPLAAPAPEDVFDAPLEEIAISRGTRVALRKAGVTGARELAALTEAQWLAIPGIADSRVQEIVAALHRLSGHEVARRIKRGEGVAP